MANRLYWNFNMSRLAVSTNIVLSVFLITISTGVYATEIARYDEGPFAGMGYPYSESARVGNLLFLAGQIGEDADSKLVPGLKEPLLQSGTVVEKRYSHHQNISNHAKQYPSHAA